ncbi:MAG: hypothetical protein UZ21_OP11001000593 [Microgenomates bacterium OLB22]|nr:MAG: hypothetical protein UZ21_OP11001000593 [Microgenomates bacterium OLB22]
MLDYGEAPVTKPLEANSTRPQELLTDTKEISPEEIVRYLVGGADEVLAKKLAQADELDLDFLLYLFEKVGPKKAAASESFIRHPVDTLLYPETRDLIPREMEATIGISISENKLGITYPSYGDGTSVSASSVEVFNNYDGILPLIHVHTHPVNGFFSLEDFHVLFHAHEARLRRSLILHIMRSIRRDTEESAIDETDLSDDRDVDPYAIMVACPDINYLMIVTPETPARMVEYSDNFKFMYKEINEAKDELQTWINIHFDDVDHAVEVINNSQITNPNIEELKRRLLSLRKKIDETRVIVGFNHAEYNNLLVFASQDRKRFQRMRDRRALLEYSVK